MSAMKLAAFAVGSMLIASTASFGQGGPQRISPRELAAHPERYFGMRIELSAAYCSSDDKGVYDCSTDGAIHIAPTALSPARARQKVESDCGGLGTIERSRSCRARLPFTPSALRQGRGAAGGWGRTE